VIPKSGVSHKANNARLFLGEAALASLAAGWAAIVIVVVTAFDPGLTEAGENVQAGAGIVSPKLLVSMLHVTWMVPAKGKTFSGVIVRTSVTWPPGWTNKSVEAAAIEKSWATKLAPTN